MMVIIEMMGLDMRWCDDDGDGDDDDMHGADGRIGGDHDRHGRISVAHYDDDAPMAMVLVASTVSNDQHKQRTSQRSCPDNSEKQRWKISVIPNLTIIIMISF